MRSANQNFLKAPSGRNFIEDASFRKLFFKSPSDLFEMRHKVNPLFFKHSTGMAIDKQGKLVTVFYDKKLDSYKIRRLNPRAISNEDKHAIKNAFLYSYGKQAWTEGRGFMERKARLDSVVLDYEQAFRRMLSGDYSGSEKWDAINAL
ncbi:MAG TPA: hypothetical protein PLO51_05725, partial [Candidatus Micrarchaeota archaeon]|nr:hypothetical protein [Candidatus Micrarchaeota archaeon]